MIKLKISTLIITFLIAGAAFGQVLPLPTTNCLTDINGNVFSTWKQTPHPTYGILSTGAGQFTCPTRVGIGTENPQETLDVHGSGMFSSLRIATNINSTNFTNRLTIRGNILFGDGDKTNGGETGLGLEWHTSNYENGFGHKIYTSDPGGNTLLNFAVRHNSATFVDAMSISSSGNVGIGRLPYPNVQTVIQATNKVALCIVADNTKHGYGIKLIANNSLHKAIAINTQESEGQDVFRVMGDGVVYATRVRVLEAALFPDYVFDSTYELMPLAQLENCITRNKHLPNMPTAKKVKKEGMDLGKINRVLVEKVEELTLYMIAMDKRMKQLENENQPLKE